MKPSSALISTNQVKHVAKLAHLTLKLDEEEKFKTQFNKTLKIIEKFDNLDTSKVAETSQVTGLTNVFRQDEIDVERMLSQEEALSNAKSTYNDYFVVKAALDAK